MNAKLRTVEQMVDSITIKNFRSFDEVKIDKLQRVNLVVGDNGSGKTALLEALFLAAGASPELLLRARRWRGLEGNISGSPDAITEALWADMFHRFRVGRPVFIGLKGDGEQNRSVTISLYKSGAVKIVPPLRNKPGAPPTVVNQPGPIEFKYQIQGFNDHTVRPVLTSEGYQFTELPQSLIRASFYAANQTSPGAEAANHFSGLSKEYKDIQFRSVFKSIYPKINDISLELSASHPLLFVSSNDVPKKIPIGLASGGSNKLAAILLSMATMEGGLIIVDEIENGFYYKRLPEIWDAIIQFSRHYNCQVFASSHSFECIKALAAYAQQSPDDFSLLRTVSTLSGTEIRHFHGSQFADAIIDNVEVR